MKDKTDNKAANEATSETSNEATSETNNKADNKTDCKTNNESVPEEVNRLIKEMSYNCANVNVDISLLRVAEILKYMAQCDFAQGESSNDLPNDTCFGRSFMMDILGDCVQHFSENAENVGYATDHLCNTITSNKAKADRQYNDLVKLHGFYKNLIEFSAGATKTDVDLVKMDIVSLENSLSLTRSPSLVGFMRDKGANGKEAAQPVSD